MDYLVNNIAVDKNGELVDSFELKNPDPEMSYTCPYCKTEVEFNDSGKFAFFKHLPSISETNKKECPYFNGFFGGSSLEITSAIEKKKQEIESFIKENAITGYTLIPYFNEIALVKYLEKHLDENNILIRTMITTWEYDALKSGFLIIKKQALEKFLIYSKKPALMAFVGTSPDKIYITEFVKEQYGEVYFHPYLVSVSDLLEKNFSNPERLMEKNDVLESRATTGKHDDRTGIL